MYKKLSYEELLKLKSKFFDNLKYVVTSKKFSTLKDYLTVMKKQGNTIYHLARQEYVWRTIFEKTTNKIIFFDEREKIELHTDKGILVKIGNLINDKKKLSTQTQNAESIEQTLQKAFESGELASINNKPYLVYDIETSYATNDIKGIEFYMGFAYIVDQ